MVEPRPRIRQPYSRNPNAPNQDIFYLQQQQQQQQQQPSQQQQKQVLQQGVEPQVTSFFRYPLVISKGKFLYR